MTIDIAKFAFINAKVIIHAVYIFISLLSVYGEEDCLYLNIFTPTLDPNASLPVMVFIHGGYLLWGEGQTPLYSPNAKLAQTLNMVHVSIQYRWVDQKNLPSSLVLFHLVNESLV